MFSVRTFFRGSADLGEKRRIRGDRRTKVRHTHQGFEPIRFWKANDCINIVKKPRNILYCFAFLPCFSEPFALPKLHTPYSNAIFDGFRRSEPQESADFSRWATTQDAEIARCRADWFEFLMGTNSAQELARNILENFEEIQHIPVSFSDSSGKRGFFLFPTGFFVLVKCDSPF